MTCTRRVGLVLRSIRMLGIARAKCEPSAEVAMPIPGYERLACLLTLSGMRVRRVSRAIAVASRRPFLVYQC